ncbi:MAG: PilZ domain-containing protein [Planctomycetota bacterium]
MMRASVWSAPDRFAIWSGRVLNLSAGGLQLRTNDSAMGYFEPGDRVSASLFLSSSVRPATSSPPKSPNSPTASSSRG